MPTDPHPGGFILGLLLAAAAASGTGILISFAVFALGVLVGAATLMIADYRLRHPRK